MSQQRDASRGDVGPITDRGPSTDEPSTDATRAALAAYGVARDEAIWVTECAWCQRVRSNAGEWHTLQPILYGAMGGVRTHGICPRCARAATACAGKNVDTSPR